MDIEYINNNATEYQTGDTLVQLFRKASEEIVIVSPYISKNQVLDLIETLPVRRIKILTKISLEDFISKASDIQTLLKLSQIEKVKIRYYSNLHAKIYLFDKKEAIITSANFTREGLFNNLEYGVLLRGEKVFPIVNYINNIWKDAKTVTKDNISEIKKRVAQLKKEAKNFQNKIKKEIKKSSLIKLHRSHKRRQAKIETLASFRLLPEEKALKLILAHSRLKPEDKEKLVKIYFLVKNHLPEEIRHQPWCTYRYNKQRNLAINIQNYRLFRLPSEKRNMLDLIYPENDLDNLVNIISPERLKELRNQWKFKSLPCYCLKLFFDEVIKFHHNHWTSFRKACFMAAEERQGPIRETNIAVDWDK